MELILPESFSAHFRGVRDHLCRGAVLGFQWLTAISDADNSSEEQGMCAVVNTPFPQSLPFPLSKIQTSFPRESVSQPQPQTTHSPAPITSICQGQQQASPVCAVAPAAQAGPGSITALPLLGPLLSLQPGQRVPTKGTSFALKPVGRQPFLNVVPRLSSRVLVLS